MDYLAFAAALFDFASQFLASVSSWGRTHNHNASVGGVPTSHHLTWTAADVVYDERPDLDAAQAAAHALGLHIIREIDHDHIQPITQNPTRG